MLVVAILAAGCFNAEARKRASQLEFEKGRRLYDQCELWGAKKRFERALRLNANHLAAQEYLRVVKRMLGIRERIEVEPEDEQKK